MTQKQSEKSFDYFRRCLFKIPPIDVEKGYDVVDVLKEIAQNHGASPAQVAIAWILTKPFISSVIVGANKMQQLEDNLGAIALKLSAQEVEKLDTLTAPQPLYPGWMQAMGWDADRVDGGIAATPPPFQNRA